MRAYSFVFIAVGVACVSSTQSQPEHMGIASNGDLQSSSPTQPNYQCVCDNTKVFWQSVDCRDPTTGATTRKRQKCWHKQWFPPKGGTNTCQDVCTASVVACAGQDGTCQ